MHMCAILAADAPSPGCAARRLHPLGMRAPRASAGGRLDDQNNTRLHGRILT